ncbi:hypothetical protein Ancab_037665 [Ancistrocladus abbreviatus]
MAWLRIPFRSSFFCFGPIPGKAIIRPPWSKKLEKRDNKKWEISLPTSRPPWILFIQSQSFLLALSPSPSPQLTRALNFYHYHSRRKLDHWSVAMCWGYVHLQAIGKFPNTLLPDCVLCQQSLRNPNTINFPSPIFTVNFNWLLSSRADDEADMDWICLVDQGKCVEGVLGFSDPKYDAGTGSVQSHSCNVQTLKELFAWEARRKGFKQFGVATFEPKGYLLVELRPMSLDLWYRLLFPGLFLENLSFCDALKRRHAAGPSTIRPEHSEEPNMIFSGTESHHP